MNKFYFLFLQDLYPWRMLAVIVVILMIFAAAEILRNFMSIRIEVTRKFVHVAAGLVTLCFPTLFTSHLSVLLLLICFLLLLLASQRYHFLNSINAIERKSLGSVSYPLIIYICFIVYVRKGNLLFYDLPILIFVLSDPLAAFVGIQTKWIPYRIGKDSKTVAGSLAFLLSSFLLAIFLLSSNQQMQFKTIFQYSLIISLGATLTEALSPIGLDNLFVPLCTLTILHLFNL